MERGLCLFMMGCTMIHQLYVLLMEVWNKVSHKLTIDQSIFGMLSFNLIFILYRCLHLKEHQKSLIKPFLLLVIIVPLGLWKASLLILLGMLRGKNFIICLKLNQLAGNSRGLSYSVFIYVIVISVYHSFILYLMAILMQEKISETIHERLASYRREENG